MSWFEKERRKENRKNQTSPVAQPGNLFGPLHLSPSLPWRGLVSPRDPTQRNPGRPASFIFFPPSGPATVARFPQPALPSSTVPSPHISHFPTRTRSLPSALGPPVGASLRSPCRSVDSNVFKSPNRLIEQWVDQTTNRD